MIKCIFHINFRQLVLLGNDRYLCKVTGWVNLSATFVTMAKGKILANVRELLSFSTLSLLPERADVNIDTKYLYFSV